MDPTPAVRPTALAALDAFVGAWSIAALFPDAPPTGPEGRAVFAWDLGGQFLVQRVEIADPAAPASQPASGSSRPTPTPRPTPRTTSTREASSASTG